MTIDNCTFVGNCATVDNPAQLLPGTYQLTATVTLGGKKKSKTVGFSVDSCGCQPTIVVQF